MRAANALLVGLVAVALAQPAPAADPPKGKLAELVKLYQAYELPVPPKDAKLVHMGAPSRSVLNGVEQPPRVHIGFLIEPGGKDKPVKVLTGTTLLNEYSPVFVTEVKPEPISLIQDLHGSDDLDFAIQCEARGWHELAVAVMKNRDKLPKRDTKPPEAAVASSAWWYWRRAYYNDKADRAKVAKHMTAAMTAAPKLFGGENGWLEQLKLSLAPSRAKPGSTEARIDEFIDLDSWQTFALCRTPEKTPQFAAVVSQGFDAVPALLEHLNDQRLTRARTPSFNHVVGMDMTVRDFARDILLDLAAGGDAKLIASTWKKRTDPKPWLTWLKEAKKQGEEGYLVANLFTTPTHRSQATINELMLYVLESKYPARLPGVVRDALKNRPKVDLEPLTNAVARSTLKADEKKKLLAEVVASDAVERMRAGVRALFEVDRDAHRAALVDAIGRLPGRYFENYRYYEGQFADEVARTTDPKVWAAASKYALRADVGARLEWVDALVRRDKDPAGVKLRLQFAAAFQDDPATQEPGTGVARQTFWNYGRWFETLEVRNLTAMNVGEMLDVKAKPDPKWTADEWAKFRAQVATAAKAGK